MLSGIIMEGNGLKGFWCYFFFSWPFLLYSCRWPLKTNKDMKSFNVSLLSGKIFTGMKKKPSNLQVMISMKGQWISYFLLSTGLMVTYWLNSCSLILCFMPWIMCFIFFFGFCFNLIRKVFLNKFVSQTFKKGLCKWNEWNYVES